MPLFDTHCHIDVDDFNDDRAEVLARSRAAGVSDILVPGIRARTWSALLDLCDGDRGLHPALGMHPVYVDEHRDADLDSLEALLDSHPVVAVGEIGLDHAVKSLSPARQLELLERQLAIAVQRRLPVVLHVRKAHDLMLQTLRRHRPVGGICHAFNGSLQQAHAYHELGLGLGFGGMLTFERSRKLRRLATEVPIEALVLETDAPDLTVASHRFQRNSPEYLPEIAMTLATLRNTSVDEIVTLTTTNARRCLGLPDGSFSILT